MNYRKIRIARCLMGVGALILLFINSLHLDKQEIKFSKESGFYENDFYLEIKGSGGTIYYTLDSSDPNENSLVYTEPILISDASKNENIYSKITGVSLEFNEILNELKLVGDSGYSVPEALVDKANVIKAICIDDEGKCSDIITGVYFIGFEDKAGYDNMNIISIVTNPDNLFNYETGIYVAGKTFDDYFSKLSTYDIFGSTWATANYRQHGDLWKRIADISFWNSTRELIFSGTYDISIQGGGSRAWLPKNLNIYERDIHNYSELDGTKLGFDFDIDSLNLFAGSQDSLVKIKDYLVNYLTADLMISARNYIPYELFLDGEYWGTYFLTERYSKEYFEKKYDIYSDDVIMIKVEFDPSIIIHQFQVELGFDTDIDLYTSMVEYIVNNDMADEENYKNILNMIDIDSYIDYYAVEIYIANTDWPGANNALWRTKSLSTGEYADGRWRWILYDVNVALSKAYVEWDGISWTALYDPAFASLLDNEQFEIALKKRLVYLAENIFNPNIVNPLINEFQLNMAGAMRNEYKRFYGENKNFDIFYNGCEDVREFFSLRYEYILNTYREDN